VKTLELVAFGILAYLVAAPFYPQLKYRLTAGDPVMVPEPAAREAAELAVAQVRANLPPSDYAVSPNRLIIQKIGVNAPIVESKSSEYGLSKGSWLVPDTSTPDKGGNTVITGHRFKYLPPNNLTFYLLDKLAPGDIISVIWHESDYYYRVRETKIVDDSELAIQAPSKKPILTLFTCHPIYSTEQRLVVAAELMEEEEAEADPIASSTPDI
jgi:LPXTG-site transpeptidase (sortase) family protein